MVQKFLWDVTSSCVLLVLLCVLLLSGWRTDSSAISTSLFDASFQCFTYRLNAYWFLSKLPSSPADLTAVTFFHLVFPKTQLDSFSLSFLVLTRTRKIEHPHLNPSIKGWVFFSALSFQCLCKAFWVALNMKCASQINFSLSHSQDI